MDARQGDRGPRPRREHAVRLLGEVPGVGSADHQWLVQHREQLLRMSELTYRVLDLADGRRTIPQIAAELSLMTEWAVHPSEVQHIIDHKLRVLGLIAGSSDGQGCCRGVERL